MVNIPPARSVKRHALDAGVAPHGYLFIFASLVFFCCVFLLLCTVAHAFNLPDTGQTNCYDQSGKEITCPSPGNDLAQDGSYNINPKSYTIMGSNSDMVLDNNTGLMWQRQDDGNTYMWYMASGTYDSIYNPASQNICGSLNLGGYTDWRLPSKKELITIVDYSIPFPGPTTNAVFMNATVPFYWSSTGFAGNFDLQNYPYGAWFVGFDSGYVYHSSVNNMHSVRCVRGGQQSSKLTDNLDGTVTDSRTGLIWQKQDDGIERKWDTALSYCEELNLSGQSDWRLPNIIELESISDDSRYDPAVDPVFANAKSLYYWSSTTVAGTVSDATWAAWSVGFYEGFVTPDNKEGANCVRCVRGGQFQLNISMAGDGSGVVKSSPNGINCSSLCLALFPSNTMVRLWAAPSFDGSIFSGFSGDPACTDGTVYMTETKSCTATFDLCPGTTRTQIGSTNYDSISLAYGSSATSGDTIKVIASNQQEGPLDFKSGKSVVLMGGYDCSFNNIISYTVVTGSVTLSTGDVTFENIVIQ